MNLDKVSGSIPVNFFSGSSSDSLEIDEFLQVLLSDMFSDESESNLYMFMTIWSRVSLADSDMTVS